MNWWSGSHTAVLVNEAEHNAGQVLSSRLRTMTTQSKKLEVLLHTRHLKSGGGQYLVLLSKLLSFSVTNYLLEWLHFFTFT